MESNSPRSTGIVVGLGSFHYWLSSMPRARALDSIVRTTFLRSHALDGFEIVCSLEELMSWTDKLEAGFRALPNSLAIVGDEFAAAVFAAPLRTVHLPELGQLSRHGAEYLGRRLATLTQLAKIKEFTAHPDEVPPLVWEGLLKGLGGAAPISIENMDLRKRSGRELTELAQLLADFPELRFTLDICHWTEQGRADDDPELLDFLASSNSRISKLHLSAPRSNASWYSNAPEIRTNHYLTAHSNYCPSEELLRALPTELLWVIEGVIPVGGAGPLAEEIMLIRDLQNLQRGMKLSA